MNQTQTASGRPDGGKTRRRRMLGKAHILWKELRPDLCFSNDERRQELLHYACTVLGLRELISLGDLTDGQLGKLLDALAREISSPRLPGQTLPEQAFRVLPSGGSGPAVPPSAPHAADITHLASEQQVWAINKIFGHLRWSTEARSEFLKKRFNRPAATFLTPRQANKLMTILLTIAASAEIKKGAEQRGEPLKRVSREMARARFPQIKKDLGLGQLIR